MATYRMVYGNDEQVVRQTLENIDDLQREDGWVVLSAARRRYCASRSSTSIPSRSSIAERNQCRAWS